MQQFSIARTAEDLSQLSETQLHQLHQVLNAVHDSVDILAVDARHLHQHVLHKSDKSSL